MNVIGCHVHTVGSARHELSCGSLHSVKLLNGVQTHAVSATWHWEVEGIIFGLNRFAQVGILTTELHFILIFY